MSSVKEYNNVLQKNWKGKFTIPSARLYPFQWNWDSGFIALGNLYENPDRSLIEIETLFEGQWENGFLPHILFHNCEKYSNYFPSADYWNSQLSKFAPKKLKTSGITQPPVHGFVLRYLFEHGLDNDRIISLFNKIVEYHKNLYDSREFYNTGLVAIWHNWESGMDNSIWWDDILNRIPEEKIEDIKLDRNDVHSVNDSEQTRPKDLDYKRYLYLVNTLRDNKYNNIPEDFPFQIIDPVFNSILIESNDNLIALGRKLDLDTSYLEEKHGAGLTSFDKYLWNETDQIYYPYDLVAKEQIKKISSGSYIPIFAQIPDLLQVKMLIKKLKENSDIIPIPSSFVDQKGFERKNYWRGPIWVNMNWMVWRGLFKYGLIDEAEELKKKTIALVNKYGSYEYFDPFINSDAESGYGGSEFSWTAALTIDMIKSEI